MPKKRETSQIKVPKDICKKLWKIAGGLQAETGRQVTLGDVIEYFVQQETTRRNNAHGKEATKSHE